MRRSTLSLPASVDAAGSRCGCYVLRRPRSCLRQHRPRLFAQGGRIALVVWQAEELNEWITKLDERRRPPSRPRVRVRLKAPTLSKACRTTNRDHSRSPIRHAAWPSGGCRVHRRHLVQPHASPTPRRNRGRAFEFCSTWIDGRGPRGRCRGRDSTPRPPELRRTAAAASSSGRRPGWLQPNVPPDRAGYRSPGRAFHPHRLPDRVSPRTAADSTGLRGGRHVVEAMSATVRCRVGVARVVPPVGAVLGDERCPGEWVEVGAVPVDQVEVSVVPARRDVAEEDLLAVR